MAGNKGFGAKIKLAVDNSRSAHDSFQEHINSFAKKHTAPIKLTVDPSSISAIKKDIETELEKNSFSIKIKEFDITKAKKKLESDLKGSLKIDTDGKLVSDVKKVTDEVARLNSQTKILNTLQQALSSSYAKAFKSGGDKSTLSQITSDYTALMDMMEHAKNGTTEDELKIIQEYASAVQHNIDLLFEQIDVQQEIRRARKADFEAAIKSAEEVTKKQEKANKTTDDSISLLKKQASLHSQIEKYLKANTRAKDESAYGGIRSLFAKTSIDDNIKLTNKEIDEYTRQFTELKLEINKAGKEGRSFTDTLARMYEKFGGWALITKSLGMVIRATKQVYHNVVELDTAMTELKKVTDETNATYKRFFDSSISRAKELGATVSDVILATADYARLGYNIQDASVLADVSIIYKNVADGLTDINEASESIISTMQAFGIEASRAMEIVDRFNEVGRHNCPAA